MKKKKKAKLWSQLISELRKGIKLRKVEQSADDDDEEDDDELVTNNGKGRATAGTSTSPIKSSVTRRRRKKDPFESLLEQIRARRYNLKKVSLDQSIGAAIKKDARDLILDFIRSRPPLKKPSQRKSQRLSAAVLSRSQPVNLHEQLMMSIRNYSTPLRRVELVSSKTTTTTIDPSTSAPVEVKKKKLIKVDKKLLNRLTSSDDVRD